MSRPRSSKSTAIINYPDSDKGLVLPRRTRGVGRLVHQTSCPSKYAHVVLDVEPAPDQLDYSLYSWEVDDDTIPFDYFDAVLMGIKDCFEKEQFSGSHLAGAIIRVRDGTFHPIDSSELSFRIASCMALQEALEKIGVMQPS